MSDSAAPQFLVTDSDEPRAQGIALALVGAGYHAAIATDSLEGLIAAESTRPALVFLNWRMPFISGAIILQVLLSELAQPPLVVAMVESDADAFRARQTGAAACLFVPPKTEDILRLVRTLLPNQPT